MILKMYRIISIVINFILLKTKSINYGKHLVIKGIIKIKGNISLGDNVRINSHINFNPIGGASKTYLITNDTGKISIGNNVGISNSAIISHDSVLIDDNVMIGGSCKIYDTDFHSLNYNYRMEKPDKHIMSKPVVIKNGAFIGAHSIILKGVTIGKHSIIGAGSVVTKSVPDNEIWAGNPAHFIKKIED